MRELAYFVLISVLQESYGFHGLHLMSDRRKSLLVPAAKKGRRKLRDIVENEPSKFIAIPGISPPAEGKVKGWELGPDGNSVRLVAARLNGKVYVLEAACSRCAWDLNKGAIIDNTITCALCGQSYDLKSGKPGQVKALKDQGPIASFVSNLAKKAPTNKPASIAQTVKCKLDENDTVLLNIPDSFLAPILSSSSS